MDKLQALQELTEQFQKLKITERDEFERIANKLLAITFLTNKKDADRNDYYFVERFKAVFKNYFALIGWEVEVHQRYGVVSLTNTYNYNRLQLKLHESILLLIIRLLYDEKLREVSESDQIVVTTEAIHQKYLALDLQERILNKTELRAILNVFRRYHLIELLDRDVTQEDSRIVIYPSILFAVPIEKITEIHQKIQAYQGGEEDETTDED